MVQHVLLLVVAAALLVAAAPMPTLLAGLPAAVRDSGPGLALVSASARSRRWPAWMAAAVVVQTA